MCVSFIYFGTICATICACVNVCVNMGTHPAFDIVFVFVGVTLSVGCGIQTYLCVCVKMGTHVHQSNLI